MVEKIKSQHSDSMNTPEEVRFAYIYLHEQRTKDSLGNPLKNGPRRDATVMLVKHGDASTCPNYRFLTNLCFEAGRKMWPSSVDQMGNWMWPQGGVWPIKDGDIPIVPKPKPGQPMLTPEQVAQRNAWRRGYWVIEVVNYLEPGPRIATLSGGQLVDIPARVINGQAMYKSGDWGFANMHAFAYQNEQFGAKFGIDGACFTRAGEAIGSSGPKSAQQMFGSIAGTVAPSAPAPTAPTPGMPPMPAASAPPAGPVSVPPSPMPPVAPSPMPPVAPSPVPQVAAPPMAPVAPQPPVPTAPVAQAPAPGMPMPPMPAA